MNLITHIRLFVHLVPLLCDMLFCFAFPLLKSIHFQDIIVHRYRSFSHSIRETDESVGMTFASLISITMSLRTV